MARSRFTSLLHQHNPLLLQLAATLCSTARWSGPNLTECLDSDAAAACEGVEGHRVVAQDVELAKNGKQRLLHLTW